MLISRLTRNSLLIAGCLVLAACSANRNNDTPHPAVAPQTSGPEAAATDPGFALPPPSGLPASPAPRKASYTEADLYRTGNEFELSLPHDNFTAVGDSGRFGANWTNGLAGAAYCMYQFKVDGYDRARELHYYWLNGPALSGSAWVGLANFANDRWDWWPCTDSRMFPFGTFGDYVRQADAALIAAVVVAGSGASDLSFIRVGPQGATAILTPSPRAGVTPLEVTLNGGASTASYGTIEQYHWDFDGDGAIDASGPDNSATHTYSAAGTYHPRLLVETSNGELVEDVDEVTMYEPWAHTWGGETNDWIHAVCTDGEAIYVAGATASYSNGTGSAALLLKYGLDGNFEWARVWGGPVSDSYQDVAASGSAVFTSGVSKSFGAGSTDMLLQRWDSSGNLIWSRTWGKDHADAGLGVRVSGGVVYVCGPSAGLKDVLGEAMLMAWDFDGNLLWARGFGVSGEYDAAQDVQASRNPISGKTTLYLVGYTEGYGGGNRKILYSSFKDDGTQIEQWTWDNGIDTRATALVAGGLLGVDKYLVGIVDHNTYYSGLLLEIAASPAAVTWGEEGSSVQPEGLARYQSALYAACTLHDGASDTSGMLCRFSLEGALEDSLEWTDGTQFEIFEGIGNFPGGGLICVGQADSPASGWSTFPVSPSLPSIDWDVRALTAYDAAPYNVVKGSPDLQPDNITNALLDESGSEQYHEAFITVVAP